MSLLNNLVWSGLVAGLVVSSSARAGIIYSDDFSSGTAGTTTLPGWTLAGPSGSAEVADSVEYNAVGIVGNTNSGNFLAFGGGNTIGGSATTDPISGFTVGDTYTVSFNYSAVGVYVVQSLQVDVDGVSEYTTSVNVAVGNTLPDLSGVNNRLSFTFIAAAPSESLAFIDTTSSANTFGTDGLLDNVIVSSAVPEPSTWAMMLMGFAIFSFAHYRRAQVASAA